jgi:glyoxylase-like metal-dependent hydrolase (beta-lactamase superfamily II)
MGLNVGVFAGPEGILLVDDQQEAGVPRLKAEIAKLSAGPVRYIVNTHWHFDHADGNDWLHSAGAKIIAQENTRKHLSGIQRVEDWDYNFLPSPAGAIPSEVFAREHSLKLNGASIGLKYYGPAHTDGDISVTFAEANVIHVGDTYWYGIYPFIDYSTGGSIDGMIRAAEQNIAAAGSKTIVIPGHNLPNRASAVSNQDELIAFRDMLASVREKVAALKRAGRSLDEIIAARPTAPFDAKWGQFLITPALFTRLVYEGV